MQTMLTVLSLTGAAVAVWCTLQCATYAARVAREATRLRSMIGRLTSVEGSVESLQTQHRKLAGKFYATKPADPETVHPSPHYAGRGPQQAPEFCANYGQAQIEGPLSRAAACECGYCVEMRERRAEFRREFVPPTARQQVERINGAADGQE